MRVTSVHTVELKFDREEARRVVAELTALTERAEVPLHQYPELLHVAQQLNEAERMFQNDEVYP